MQLQLQVFRDEEQREFRTLEIDGEPWFVFADVCRALGFRLKKGTFSHHADRLDPEDRRTAIVPRSASKPPTSEMGGGTARASAKPSTSEVEGGITMIVVNESGLYSLLLRSDKPQAKRFKRWITSVILPSVRKTGSFGPGARPVMADWQPFHDRISAVWGAVPAGYFSVFRRWPS
jgi:prophage antirepressor-like protein